jgi:hypothetical protein
LRLLTVLYRETGDRRYLDAIQPALNWLKRSVLPPVAEPSEIRRRTGEPAIARFHELRTNRPLYITKGTQVQAKGLGSARIDGYELSYTDESVITHYAVVTSAKAIPAIEKEFHAVSASREPRPEKLHGLSPWAGDRRASKPSADRARLLLSALDARGAWSEDGVIGKADRVASVFAARDMTVTIGNRAYPVKENETVQIFQGPQPPRTRIIRSTRFAENLESLAALYADAK